MDKSVFIVVNVDLTDSTNTSIEKVFDSLDYAMEYAYGLALSVSGHNIKAHGKRVVDPAVEYTNVMISNNHGLYSDYGISYKAYHSNKSMAKLVVEKIVTEKTVGVSRENLGIIVNIFAFILCFAAVVKFVSRLVNEEGHMVANMIVIATAVISFKLVTMITSK